MHYTSIADLNLTITQMTTTVSALSVECEQYAAENKELKHEIYNLKNASHHSSIQDLHHSESAVFKDLHKKILDTFEDRFFSLEKQIRSLTTNVTNPNSTSHNQEQSPSTSNPFHKQANCMGRPEETVARQHQRKQGRSAITGTRTP
ncbi:unnamed protein product [Ceutorhynchus assimilis]|uniref:Uncharacterized protein n=1 Tax=Ceutorhynchus assimilis TaxID=467358 RepID=A0A9N9MUB3_9CUCU|nr:unnamed protein product [Ceutorhynchus assimilis]